MSKNQIGWQKYEDMLEEQMHSPLFRQLYQSFQDNIHSESLRDLEDFSEEEIEELLKSQEAELQHLPDHSSYIPVDDKLIENMNLVSNFDCWMAYTNFNITEEIKSALDQTEGVEALKICSRYRFFVGIGKMFDFKDVRKTIEQTIIKQENNIE
jgi:hypothetical protein